MSSEKKELVIRAVVDFDIEGALQAMAGFGNQTNNMERELAQTVQKATINMEMVKKGFNTLLNAGVNAFQKMASASPALSAQLTLMNFWFSEIWRTVGDALAPVMEDIVEIVKKVADWFKSLPEPVKKFIGVVALLAVGISALIPVITAITAISSPWLLIIGAIIAAVALLYLAFKSNFGGIRDFFISVWDKIKAAWDSLKPHIEALWQSIKAFWAVIKPVIMKIWEIFKTYFKGAISNAIERVKIMFTFLFTHIKNIFDFITKLIKGDWKGAWEAFKNIFKNIWEYVKNMFKNMWETIKNFFGNLIDKFLKWGWEAIKNFFKGIWDGITSGFKRIGDAFKKLFGFGSLPTMGPLRMVPEWGKGFGEEFLKGISAGVNLHSDLATGKLQGAFNGLATPTAGGTASANKTYNLTVNVDAKVSSDMDITRMTDKIASELLMKFQTGSDW